MPCPHSVMGFIAELAMTRIPVVANILRAFSIFLQTVLPDVLKRSCVDCIWNKRSDDLCEIDSRYVAQWRPLHANVIVPRPQSSRMLINGLLPCPAPPPSTPQSGGQCGNFSCRGEIGSQMKVHHGVNLLWTGLTATTAVNLNYQDSLPEVAISVRAISTSLLVEFRPLLVGIDSIMCWNAQQANLC